jgi:cytochrome c
LKQVSLTIAFVLLATVSAFAEDDPGAKLFKNHCSTCHSLGNDGSKKLGPNLLGLFTRKSGTQPDYGKYSEGLKAANWQWTPEQLDLWLTDPKALVPTTFMSVYKQKDPEKRKIIIEYIKANGGL